MCRLWLKILLGNKSNWKRNLKNRIVIPEYRFPSYIRPQQRRPDPYEKYIYTDKKQNITHTISLDRRFCYRHDIL